ILFFPFLRLSSPRSTLFPYTTLFRSDHYRQQLIVLEKRRDEMTAKEEQLKQAEQASFIQPYEQQWLGSKEQVQQREVLLKQKMRSEEHTSELQSRFDLVCRLLLEKKN